MPFAIHYSILAPKKKKYHQHQNPKFNNNLKSMTSRKPLSLTGSFSKHEELEVKLPSQNKNNNEDEGEREGEGDYSSFKQEQSEGRSFSSPNNEKPSVIVFGEDRPLKKPKLEAGLNSFLSSKFVKTEVYTEPSLESFSKVKNIFKFKK